VQRLSARVPARACARKGDSRKGTFATCRAHRDVASRRWGTSEYSHGALGVLTWGARSNHMGYFSVLTMGCSTYSPRGTVSTHTCSIRRCASGIHRFGRRRRLRWCRRTCSLRRGGKWNVRTRRRARACARGGLASHAVECCEYSQATLWILRASAHADCEYSFTIGQ
jgi:hypothetical protein